MFMMIGSTDIHLITLKSPKLDGKKDCLMKSRIYYTNQKFGTLLFVARKTLPFLQLEALSWSHKFSACFTLIHTLSWSQISNLFLFFVTLKTNCLHTATARSLAVLLLKHNKNHPTLAHFFGFSKYCKFNNPTSIPWI